MTVTPEFKLEQTDSFLNITIIAPFAHHISAETTVQDCDFNFHSAPYYLRLHLPGPIIETDDSSGDYDEEEGIFNYKFCKVNQNEHFPNLDSPYTFLARPPCKKDGKPKNGKGSKEDKEVEDTDGSEWLIEQQVPPRTEQFTNEIITYGFANKARNAFLNFPKSDLEEIFDVPHPDKISIPIKIRLQQLTEESEFEPNHYLADLIEPLPFLIERLEYQPGEFRDSLTEAEEEVLKNIRCKEIVVPDSEINFVYFSLVDILYAYAYNKRCFLGGSSCESAWTINKISATLCWLQNFMSVKEAISFAMKRSLCYPLYRHWTFCLMVLEDLKRIFEGGQLQILICLLEIHELFEQEAPRHILNKLYIKDYIRWIQKEPASRIQSYKKLIDEAKMTKRDVLLDLDELEHAARLVLHDAENKHMADNFKKLVISSFMNNSSEESDETHSAENSDAADSGSSDSEDSDSSDSEDSDSSEDNETCSDSDESSSDCSETGGDTSDNSCENSEYCKTSSDESVDNSINE